MSVFTWDLQGPLGRQHFLSPAFSQVLPFWIHRLDQRNLLFARPSFDLFFPANSGADVAERFVIDQSVNVVPAGEPKSLFALVLQRPPVQAVGDPGVERSGKAGKDVNVIEALLAEHERKGNGSILSDKRSLSGNILGILQAQKRGLQNDKSLASSFDCPAPSASTGSMAISTNRYHAFFLQIPQQLVEFPLILVVVLPLGKIRDVVFADFAGPVFAAVSVKTFPRLAEKVFENQHSTARPTASRGRRDRSAFRRTPPVFVPCSFPVTPLFVPCYECEEEVAKGPWNRGFACLRGPKR